MAYISGWLIEGPVDPGYGNRPGGPGIDNSLPGSQPGIDNSLPPYLDNSLPIPPPPPGIWPPPGPGRPIVPVGPDNTLPVTPGTIWPSPGRPPRPDHSLPGGQGGQIDNSLPSQTFWMIAYCPTLGWKYIAVDPSLEVGNELPPHAEPR